jgi:hypothetical protein
MRRGQANPVAEVVKLQAFLRDFEKMNISVTGIFDLTTENAVNAFQTKYASVVLAPWGDNEPSGYVYITTTKNINKIACNQPLTLNARELAIIGDYKSKLGVSYTLANRGNGGSTIASTNGTSTIAVGTTTPSGSIGSDDTSNTASAVNTNLWQKIKGFVKWVFRR